MGPPPVPPLPYYLKRKKKFVAVGTMKKFNWSVIDPWKIMKTSLWVTCQSDTLVTDDILTELSANFSQKPAKIVSNKTLSSKIDLQVLDNKSAQNILIFKRGLFKNVSDEQIVHSILNCEMSMDFVEGLIQCLPKPDILEQIKEKEGHKLSEAETFVATLCQIGELMPRLRSIRFKLDFAAIVKDLEPEIVTAIDACNEIRTSKKLAKIFELILVVGNFMNSGSIYAPAFGFEISFLTKLTDTKDSSNKRTILHHLVDIIKMKFPDLLSFGDELRHIEKVSSTSSEKIENVIGEITESLTELEYVLEKSNGQQSSNDKFVEKMSGFAMQCKDQLKTLVELKNELENSYTLVAAYFSFDVHQYEMGNFFSDIMSFKKSFAKAYEENLKIKSVKYQANSNKSIKNHESMKMKIKRDNQKKLSYPVTTQTIKTICRRELVLKIKNLSKEGLCFLFSSFSSFL